MRFTRFYRWSSLTPDAKRWVILITLISVLASVSIDLLFEAVLGKPLISEGLIISMLVPLIVAPLAGMPLVTLLSEFSVLNRKLEQAGAESERHKADLTAEIEKFESLCEQTPMSWWRLDLKTGQVIYNRLLAKRWALPVGGTVDVDDLFSLQTTAAVKMHQQAIEILRRTKSTSVVEHRGETGEFKDKWYRFKYWPTLDEHQQVIAVNCTNTEVGELMQAKESAETALENTATALKRLNKMAKAGGIGLFTHNIKADVYTCNDTFRDIFGLSHADYPEVSMQDTASRFDPLLREQYHRERMAAREVQDGRMHERKLLLPDGTRKTVLLNVYPEYKNGELYAMTGAAYDITEKQQLLEEKTATLERQRELFAVIGHELRTPVASIEMLSQDSQYSDAEKVSLVTDISKGLLGVLEDLRTVIAPERANEAVTETAAPSVVVKRALGPLSQLLYQSGMQLHLDMPTDQHICQFNVQALRQLVTNLTKNAALHSGASNLWVSLTKDLSQTGRVGIELRVEDDGIGIAPESAELLFAPYQRGDTQADGSGLGLYICKELSHKLGGVLSYETSNRGGAAFVLQMDLVSVDAVTEAQAEAASEQEQRVSLEGLRVLMAEDDRMLRMLTENQLKKVGAQVQACADGEAALEAYRPEQFDIVLTDIMMPKLNGYQLTRALRDEGYHGVIIGVTAAAVGEEGDELLQAGADAVIHKPISIDKFRNALSAPAVAAKLRHCERLKASAV